MGFVNWCLETSVLCVKEVIPSSGTADPNYHPPCVADLWGAWHIASLRDERDDTESFIVPDSDSENR